MNRIGGVMVSYRVCLECGSNPDWFKTKTIKF